MHWSALCWILEASVLTPVLWYTPGVLQFSSVLTLKLSRIRHIPQVKGHVLCKTFLTSDACLGGHLHFWLTGCRFGGSHNPNRLHNSLEWLTERTHWKQYTYSFIIKDIDQDQPHEETHRAEFVGEDAALLCSLLIESRRVTISAHQCVTNQEASLSLRV